MKVTWELLDIYGGRSVCLQGVYSKIIAFYLVNEGDGSSEELYTLITDFGVSRHRPMARGKLVELLANGGYEPANERRS